MLVKQLQNNEVEGGKTNVEYCIIDLTHGFDPNVITLHAALNYKDVTNQYSKEQIDFINELNWVKL